MLKRNTELNEQAMKAMNAKDKSGKTPEGKDSMAGMNPDSAAKAVDQMARTQGKLPSGVSEEEKKELMEVMKLAAQMEKAEEDAMLKKAMEESEHQLERQKTQQMEEDEMMKQVLEQSAKEEEERVKRIAAEKVVLEQA